MDDQKVLYSLLSIERHLMYNPNVYRLYTRNMMFLHYELKLDQLSKGEIIQELQIFGCQ